MHILSLLRIQEEKSERVDEINEISLTSREMLTCTNRTLFFVRGDKMLRVCCRNINDGLIILLLNYYRFEIVSIRYYIYYR